MFLAGLVIAAVAMLALQVLVMILAGAPPAFLTFAALLIVISVPTAGAAVAWAGARLSAGWTEERAALLFAALGLVVGVVWGSLVAGGIASRLTDGSSGLTLAVATVAGVSAAVGAGLGRITAREASGRPVLVVTLAVLVVLVAAAGLLV